MTIPDFDAVLVVAQRGGEWAFTLIYRELNPRILRYLWAQAPDVADDLASETWLGVAKRLHEFAGDETAFRGWVFAIARNRLVQHWRDRGRRPGDPVSPEILSLLAAPDEDATGATALANLGGREAARAVALALPHDQAEVVLLRLLGGLGVEQVAGLLGKRAGTVRVLQHKALRRLSQIFSQEALTR